MVDCLLTSALNLWLSFKPVELGQVQQVYKKITGSYLSPSETLVICCHINIYAQPTNQMIWPQNMHRYFQPSFPCIFPFPCILYWKTSYLEKLSNLFEFKLETFFFVSDKNPPRTSLFQPHLLNIQVKHFKLQGS